MPNQDQTEGKIREVGGKVTGDDQVETKGKAQKGKGDTKEKAKGVGRAVKDAVSGGRKR